MCTQGFRRRELGRPGDINRPRGHRQQEGNQQEEKPRGTHLTGNTRDRRGEKTRSQAGFSGLRVCDRGSQAVRGQLRLLFADLREDVSVAEPSALALLHLPPPGSRGSSHISWCWKNQAKSLLPTQNPKTHFKTPSSTMLPQTSLWRPGGDFPGRRIVRWEEVTDD